MKTQSKINPRELRRKLGLTQSQFWKRVGVGQSGGSRYESGRDMPEPVVMLLGVVYLGKQVEAYRP